MKILEAVQKIREKFGKNAAVQITAEHFVFSGGEVRSEIKAWVSLPGLDSRCETDTTLSRAVNKLINDIEPTAVQAVVEQVEEMAGK